MPAVAAPPADRAPAAIPTVLQIARQPTNRAPATHPVMVSVLRAYCTDATIPSMISIANTPTCLALAAQPNVKAEGAPQSNERRPQPVRATASKYLILLGRLSSSCRCRRRHTHDCAALFVWTTNPPTSNLLRGMQKSATLGACKLDRCWRTCHRAILRHIEP
jgi:hypothetical protein